MILSRTQNLSALDQVQSETYKTNVKPARAEKGVFLNYAQMLQRKPL